MYLKIKKNYRIIHNLISNTSYYFLLTAGEVNTVKSKQIEASKAALIMNVVPTPSPLIDAQTLVVTPNDMIDSNKSVAVKVVCNDYMRLYLFIYFFLQWEFTIFTIYILHPLYYI